MKKALGLIIASLVVSPACAADQSVMAPRYKAPLYQAPPPAPLYNWSGFYVGGNLGYGWGANTNPNVGFADPNVIAGFDAYVLAGGNVFQNFAPKGFLGGGQIGADHQWGAFVAGAVVDFQGADISGSSSATVTPPNPAGGLPFATSTQTLSQKLDFLGTVRGRVGLAWNNWLFYGTGGLAHGHETSSMSFSAPAGPVFLSGTSSQYLSGWAAGGGINYGFANWIAGAEYLHYDLGTANVAAVTQLPGGIAAIATPLHVAGDIVRGNLSYKLGY
jgi:outer membrane immunogenic protein